jgi:hypothetical protein
MHIRGRVISLILLQRYFPLLSFSPKGFTALPSVSSQIVKGQTTKAPPGVSAAGPGYQTGISKMPIAF